MYGIHSVYPGPRSKEPDSGNVQKTLQIPNPEGNSKHVLIVTERDQRHFDKQEKFMTHWVRSDSGDVDWKALLSKPDERWCRVIGT